MTASRKVRNWIPFIIAIVLCLAGGSAMLGLHLRSDADLLETVEQNVEADFRNRIRNADELSGSLVKQFSVGRKEGKFDGAVRLGFQEGCRLVSWNDPEWMPSARIVSDLCNFPDRRILQDKNKVFYYLRHEHNGFMLITLIPVQVTYKVDNSNLPPYLFLGRYNGRNSVEARVSKFGLHLRQTENAATVYDEAGNFIFALTLPGIEVFSFRNRAIALGGFGAGLILLFLFLYRWLARRLGRKWAALTFSLLLIILRGVALVFGFPANFLPVEFFSPTLLALDSFTPSLGDLLLNISVFLAITLILIRVFHRSISAIYRRVLTTGLWAWVLHMYILGFSIVLITFFFHELDLILLNSKINFDFNNVFSLDIYSLIAFVVIGMMLLGLQLILYQILRFSYHFLFPDRKAAWGRIGSSVLVLVGASLWVWGWAPAYLVVVVSSVILTMIILGRTRNNFVFRLDILNFLLAITLFSLLTSVGIATGDKTRRKAEMELIADRLSDEHDLVTESLFERVRREIREASYILQYSKGDISEGLKENYFQQSFKGYEVRVYVYDKDSLELVDGDPEPPMLPPGSGVEPEEAGISTMTEGLYLMPYFRDVFDYIYVGEFDLLLRQFGWLLVQVELRPNELRPNQLYPNLLLDDNIRSKEFVSNDYDYAIYREGELFRKVASGSFPRLLHQTDNLQGASFVHQQTDGYDQVLFQPSEDKVIVVRSGKMGVFETANLFSFVFYFNILAFIFLMSPFWVTRLIRSRGRILKGSLRARIQILFLSLSVIPLFIVIFLLSPYIKERIYQELSASLQDETARVASMVRDYYSELSKSQPGASQLSQRLKVKLAEIEKTIFNDVNIYHRNGQLDFTTQPTIYELGLNSEYMNPEVFRKIRSGDVFDMVVEEKIGNLSYFSGYYPILSNNRTVLGFLNIPFLKNQDEVNEQALSLLTFLVDIYVFVFLALGFVAVLVSNSIIRPLSLLSMKLEQTTLGNLNEPIEWESGDEIGDIIQAYNQMLDKLAESEEKLARNQREMAWKEMARQVAHEIKNPLTPMKLSVQHLIRGWEEESPNLEKLFRKVTNTILVQIDSLVNIANSFSEFAKMPEPERSVFVLQEVIREVAELYEHHEEVQFNMHLQEPDFYVNFDRDQLSRVFNNLVKNGMQAIEHDQGRIIIRMEIRGNKAYIDISDNGKGIPDDIRKKIFQPNFSTKSSGMGLGLAIVKKIIEGSGGTIDFESEVGEGTTFHIILPEATPEA